MKIYFIIAFLFTCAYSLTAQQIPIPAVEKKEACSQEIPAENAVEATLDMLSQEISPADSTVLSKRTIRWMHDPKRKRTMWAKK